MAVGLPTLLMSDDAVMEACEVGLFRIKTNI